MLLEIEQNNHLLNLTLDVWQDQIFSNDSAFSAGYFAADILNASDEMMREILTHGGEISFQAALANAGEKSLSTCYRRHIHPWRRCRIPYACAGRIDELVERTGQASAEKQTVPIQVLEMAPGSGCGGLSRRTDVFLL